MTERDKLRVQLTLHEGRRTKPYMDTVGKITIGVGRNLSDVGLHEDEIDHLLTNDIEDAEAGVRAYPFWAQLDPIRQRVLVDMRFNLGGKLDGFGRTLRLVGEGNYTGAGEAMRNSLWYRQVKTRGERLVRMMRTGEDYRSWP